MRRVVVAAVLLALLYVPPIGAQPLLDTRLVPRLVYPSGANKCSAVRVGSRLVTAGHCIDAPTQRVDMGTGPATTPVACLSLTTDVATLLPTFDGPRAQPQTRLPEPGTVVWAAGWPSGAFVVQLVRVLGLAFDVVLKDTPPTRIPAALVAEDLSGALVAGGVSGGGAFSQAGEYLGTICCINKDAKAIGIVPVRDALQACRGLQD